MDRDSLKSTLVILPVLAIMGTAGLYLWKDLKTTDDSVTHDVVREPIGYMIQQSSNVKRKLGDSLYWNSINEKEVLYSKDSIRTGSDSFAILQLNDRSKISLAENSLIVLEKGGDQLNIDFKTGDIETLASDKNLKIKVNDTVLDSKSSELKLSTDSKNNTQIVVTKGTATLTDKNKKKTEIATKKVVSVDEKGQAKQVAVPLILNSPRDKVTILDPEKLASYPFTWTVLEDDLKEQTIEISQTADFKKISFAKSSHQTAQAQIVRGTNYWRVTWKDKDGKPQYSDIRTLTLDEDKRVMNVAPINNSVIDQEPGQDTVSFAWTALGDPKSYSLEIAKDPEFSVIVQNQSSTTKTLDSNSLKDGKYYWRVKAFAENGKEMGRSAPGQFTLRRILPTLPALISPTNGFKWTLNDPLMFEWKPAEKVKQYRWTISKDPNQLNIVNQFNTAEAKHLWKWTKAGDYYWSVVATDEKGEIIGRSLLQKVSINPTVTGPAIVLKSPVNQATVSRDRKDPMDPVVFEWTVERPIAAGPFTFYISEKPDFSEARKKEGVESLKYALRLEKSGNYYWKVEWINPEQRVPAEATAESTTEVTPEIDREVSGTGVIKYRISNNILAPVLVEPLDNAKKFIAKKTPVEFRWQKRAGAEQYRITVEQEHTKTKERIPVLSTTTDQNTFTSQDLEPGEYYWYVNSLDKDKIEGSPSTQRKLIIELSKELAAPKLKPPVIK